MFKAISRFVEGLLIGSVAGYIAGLLSAPKTGKQLRSEVADQSDQLYRQASDSIEEMKGKAAHTMQEMQVKGEDLVKKASVNVRETGKKVASKFDAAVTHATNTLVDDNEIIGA